MSEKSEREIEDQAETITREVLQIYRNWNNSMCADYPDSKEYIMKSTVLSSISVCCCVSVASSLSVDALKKIIDKTCKRIKDE